MDLFITYLVKKMENNEVLTNTEVKHRSILGVLALISRTFIVASNPFRCHFGPYTLFGSSNFWNFLSCVIGCKLFILFLDIGLLALR